MDNSFNQNGSRTIDLGDTDLAGSVAVQSDGKIVLGASSGASVIVLRLNADGTDDASFSGDGRIVVPGLAADNSDASDPDRTISLALDAGGNILVGNHTARRLRHRRGSPAVATSTPRSAATASPRPTSAAPTMSTRSSSSPPARSSPSAPPPAPAAAPARPVRRRPQRLMRRGRRSPPSAPTGSSSSTPRRPHGQRASCTSATWSSALRHPPGRRAQSSWAPAPARPQTTQSTLLRVNGPARRRSRHPGSRSARSARPTA